MRKWKLEVGDVGFDFFHVLADDILLFARSALEMGKILDSLVAKLSRVGVLLNAAKIVVLTSQNLPLSTITTDHKITLTVPPGNVAQKWLGCILIAYGLEQKKPWICNTTSGER